MMRCYGICKALPMIVILLMGTRSFGQATNPLNEKLAEGSRWSEVEDADILVDHRLNEKLAEGSRWSGVVKHRSDSGFESSSEVDVIITKRDGKNFEGRYELKGQLKGQATIKAELKGTISGTKIKFHVAKLVGVEPNKINRNFVGLEFNGQVRRNTRTKATVLEATYNWPNADNVKDVRHGLLSVALQN